MWRAFFIALGITLCLLGVEFMVVEKAVLAKPLPKDQPTPFTEQLRVSDSGREIRPPEWTPWSLVSAGAVILLYSFTIPRRVAQ